MSSPIILIFGAGSNIGVNVTITSKATLRIPGLSAKSARRFPRSLENQALSFKMYIVAIKESLASFKSLPETASRTFIYTGNAMNFLPFGGVMTLGAGKSALAHMIASAAAAYVPNGYKFYYADEKKADGRLSGKTISGEAHGQFYKEI